MSRGWQFAALAFGSLLWGSLEAQTFSDWSTPVNLGTTINSIANDV